MIVDPQSPIDYSTVFNVMPGISALVFPDASEFTVVAATDEFTAFANASKQDIIGKSLFKYLPDNPEAHTLSEEINASLTRCLNTRQKSEVTPQRFDTANPDGTFNEMYWTVIHTPILGENGELNYILHTLVNATEQVFLEINNEKLRSLEPVHNLFVQSTVAIHIFKGPDLVVALANEPTLILWNKDKSVIGKPVREALPELSEKFIKLVESVRDTGIPYQAHETPVILHRNGSDDTGYFNFVLQPYYEDGQESPVGVIAMVNEVTEIYHRRKKLAEKERSLDLAVEIGDLGIFSIDLRSGIVSYSPQIMQWFGLTRLNLSLDDLLKKIHPDDYEIVSSTLKFIAQRQRGAKHDLIFRVPHPRTGEIQYLHSIGQVQAEDGETVTLSGIIQDITVSIKSKFAIEQSTQRLKSLIESAPFPIGVYIGKEMRIEMMNQALLDAWGRDSSVIGKRYVDVLPELEKQGIYQQLDNVYATGKAFHAHNQQVDLAVDGKLQTFYFNYSFTPLFDATGKVYGVMNTAADVTDLNLAKKALEVSEGNFRSMIQQAPVAMCIFRGKDFTFGVVNPMMEVLLGRKASELEGRPLFEAVPEIVGVKPILRDITNQGVSYISEEQEFKLPRDGQKETVYIRYIYEPMKDASGNVEGIMAVATDVTQQVLARRKIEDIVSKRTRELADANQRLQNSNAELEQFAYIASHDLQEPLRKISMFSQMLESSLGGVNERAQYQMDRINNAVNRMTNLIRDILGYSQLSRKNEVFVRTDLQEIFNEAIADFDLIAEEKQGTITQSGLPVVEAIPLQMSQLFNNLISNSLKYSQPYVPPRIHVSGEKLADSEAKILRLPKKRYGYYKLTFSDNGIGFQQEYADKIFHIFQRLHSKTQYEGTGIGLAMCKKIIENHNGIIYATAREGQGAEFVVIVPVEQEDPIRTV